jgi:hypothetical protein
MGILSRISFKFEVKSSVSVDRLTPSVIYLNLLESNYTLLPKENLFPMTYSTSLQINKNYVGQHLCVSRVQIKLYNPVPRLEKVFLYFPPDFA